MMQHVWNGDARNLNTTMSKVTQHTLRMQVRKSFNFRNGEAKTVFLNIGCLF